MAATETQVRTSEPPKFRVRDRLRELWAHREVLTNLTRKELKIKYKSSVLGIAWSMLNPLLYLLVFYVVFTFVLPANIPDFAVFLLSGLLGWTLFSRAFEEATGSVVANAPLVTKVAFPREILPLAAVGSSLLNFVFQFLVLIAAMLVFGYPFFGTQLLLLPLALGTLLVFTAAMGFLTSAMNVRYRDTSHLVELGLLAWFWFTPVIYPATVVLEKSRDTGSLLLFRLYQTNPMVQIVLGFQRSLYGAKAVSPGTGEPIMPDPSLSWYAIRLGMVAVASLVLLWLTWRVFFNRSGDFAEEL